jgi:hypothetical protein
VPHSDCLPNAPPLLAVRLTSDAVGDHTPSPGRRYAKELRSRSHGNATRMRACCGDAHVGTLPRNQAIHHIGRRSTAADDATVLGKVP